MRKEKKDRIISVVVVLLVLEILVSTASSLTPSEIELIDDVKQHWGNTGWVDESEQQVEYWSTSWLRRVDQDDFIDIQEAESNPHLKDKKKLLEPGDKWQANQAYRLIIPFDLSDNAALDNRYCISVQYPDEIKAGSESSIFVKIVDHSAYGNKKSYFRYTVLAQDDLQLAHGDWCNRPIGGCLDAPVHDDEIWLYFCTPEMDDNNSKISRRYHGGLTSCEGSFRVEYLRQSYPKTPEGQDDLAKIWMDASQSDMVELMQKLEAVALEGDPYKMREYEKMGITFVKLEVEIRGLSKKDDNIWRLSNDIHASLQMAAPISNVCFGIDQTVDEHGVDRCVCQTVIVYRGYTGMKILYGWYESALTPNTEACFERSDSTISNIRRHIVDAYGNTYDTVDFYFHIAGE